jgi:hypothetical protein
MQQLTPPSAFLPVCSRCVNLSAARTCEVTVVVETCIDLDSRSYSCGLRGAHDSTTTYASRFQSGRWAQLVMPRNLQYVDRHHWRCRPLIQKGTARSILWRILVLSTVAARLGWAKPSTFVMSGKCLGPCAWCHWCIWLCVKRKRGMDAIRYGVNPGSDIVRRTTRTEPRSLRRGGHLHWTLQDI